MTSRKAVAKQIRLATPEECVTTFGYAPGTVPPVGHRQQCPLIVDTSCAASSHLLGGGGSANCLMHLQTCELLALDFVTVAEIALVAAGSAGSVVGVG